MLHMCVPILLSLIDVIHKGSCTTVLMGGPLSTTGFRPQTGLEDVALADESIIKNTTQGKPLIPSSQLVQNSSSLRFVSPWLIHEQNMFDIQLQQDMQAMSQDLQENNSSPEFLRSVRVGRCKAKCFSLFDTELGKLRSDRGFLVPAACADNNKKCKLCEEACEVPDGECDTFCRQVSGEITIAL